MAVSEVHKVVSSEHFSVP